MKSIQKSFIIIFCILFIACKKKEATNESAIIAGEINEQEMFFDRNVNLHLQPADNSKSEYEFDVNKDGINDFRITAKNNFKSGKLITSENTVNTLHSSAVIMFADSIDTDKFYTPKNTEGKVMPGFLPFKAGTAILNASVKDTAINTTTIINDWDLTANKFVCIKYILNDKLSKMGWIKLSINDSLRNNVVIHSWAMRK